MLDCSPPSPPALTWTHHTETWREPLLNKSRFPLSSPPLSTTSVTDLLVFKKSKNTKLLLPFRFFYYAQNLNLKFVLIGVLRDGWEWWGGGQYVFIIKRLMISICTILGVADVFIKYIFKINLIIYNTLNSGLCHIGGRGGMEVDQTRNVF